MTTELRLPSAAPLDVPHQPAASTRASVPKISETERLERLYVELMVALGFKSPAEPNATR